MVLGFETLHVKLCELKLREPIEQHASIEYWSHLNPWNRNPRPQPEKFSKQASLIKFG